MFEICHHYQYIMSSSKPLYIPKRRKVTQQSDNNNSSSSTRGNNKKPKQERFHGAFTGGFSAGHFNTVGSKEGWIPSQDKKKEQRLEDFMDDEDHESWGGPTRLREDYGTKALTNKSIVDDDTTITTGDLLQKREDQQSTFLPLKSLLEVSHETVGPRLLRRLGWRKEGGMAIVPENTTTKLAIGTRLLGRIGEDDDDTLKNLTRIHLSRKKLRQIRLQTTRIKLPPPKLDQCGLGFEPYENAPEFQKYREKRKQQARDRASYDTNENIYRISDVASGINGKGGPVPHSHQPDKSSNEQSEYLSYETAEDFVGKRSTGGFALRDDEDDAYDDDPNANHPKNGSQLNSTFKPGEEYNTEVYEHESSDDDCNVNTTITNSRLSTVGGDKHSQHVSKPVDVGDMFAAWAGSNALSDSNYNSKPTVLTDGKPPLSGFVLGDSMNTNKRRYPGPDIPREYTIQRHKFGENENPYVFEAISNAMKLERKEERTKSQLGQQQQQQKRQLKLPHDEENRPLSNNFSSLGEAMKLRFTKESTNEQKDDVPGGLCMPNPVEKKDDFKESDGEEKPQITISRTVETFLPSPLVCKRFDVPLPRNSSKNAGLIAVDDKRDTESAYFEREILKKASQCHNQNKELPVQNNSAPENEENCEEVHKGIDRPSIEKLKSIFEPSSDESSSEDESIEDDDNTDKETSELQAIVNDSKETENSLIQNIHKSSDVSQELVDYLPPSSKEGDDNNSYCSSTDESAKAASSRKRKKEKHRKRHHRKRRSRKRSHSVDQDSDRSSINDEEEEEEKERRRERRRKHKKKRKKSSHSRGKTRAKDI